STSSGPSQFTLELGSGTANIGVRVRLSDGKLSVTYIQKYEPVETTVPEVLKMAKTQLRMATIFCWTNPSLAQDLASHVARVTFNSAAAVTQNMQAVALSRQMRAEAIAGPNMSFAPVLSLASYQNTLSGAIAVCRAFENGFDRFSDRKAAIQDQIAAWD